MPVLNGGKANEHLRTKDKKTDAEKAHRQQRVVVHRRQPQRGDRNHQPQREQQEHRRALAAEQQIRSPAGEQRPEQAAGLEQHDRGVSAQQVDAVALRQPDVAPVVKRDADQVHQHV